jgi:YHS domain-containing protein
MGSLVYFLIWAGAFFLMMRFGCGAHIMGHGHSGKHANEPHSTSDAAPMSSAPATAIDPVCGMNVQTATAKNAVAKGQVNYFCSAECRDKFEARPDSYPPRQTDSSVVKELARAR